MALQNVITLKNDGTRRIFKIDDSPAALPIINVSATDNIATEVGPTTGTFTISSDIVAGAGGISVGYSLSGTAVDGTDYTINASPAVITSGNNSIPVIVTPIDDALSEPAETVILTLDTNASYSVGPNNSGTVTIYRQLALDPVNISVDIALSNNDLTATATNAGWHVARSLFPISGGKKYFEGTFGVGTNDSFGVGIVQVGTTLDSYIGQTSDAWGFLGDGFKTHNGFSGLPSSSLAIGETVGVYVDFDLGLMGLITPQQDHGNVHINIPSGEYYAAIGCKSANQGTINFGASPFVYTIPAGYSPAGA